MCIRFMPQKGVHLSPWVYRCVGVGLGIHAHAHWKLDVLHTQRSADPRRRAPNSHPFNPSVKGDWRPPGVCYPLSPATLCCPLWPAGTQPHRARTQQHAPEEAVHVEHGLAGNHGCAGNEGGQHRAADAAGEVLLAAEGGNQRQAVRYDAPELLQLWEREAVRRWWVSGLAMAEGGRLGQAVGDGAP